MKVHLPPFQFIPVTQLTRWAILPVLALIIWGTGCATTHEPHKDITYLDNFKGTAKEREMYFHLPEGSEVIPLRLLKALRSVETGKPFLENIERLGYLSDPGHPDGLAIGMAKGPPTIPIAGLLGKSVGFNCAACHTAEFQYQGKSFRVMGAPAKADFDAFANDLSSSGQSTIRNPLKFVRFLAEFGFPQKGQGWNQQTITSEDKTTRDKALESLGEQTLSDEQAQVVTYLRELATDPAEVVPVAMSTEYSTQERAQLSAALQSHVTGEMAELAVPMADASVPSVQKNLRPLVNLWKSEAGGLNATSMQLDAFDQSITYATLESTQDTTNQGVAIGRVDAFGKARGVIFDEDPKNVAPVSYPHIWDLEEHPWLHFDGNTNSIVERNVGQAIGVQASFNRQTYATSANVTNILKLEDISRKIRPPKWPEDIFTKLDPKKVTAGEKLYAANCASCHDTKVSGDYRMFAPHEVGTSALRAKEFARPLGDGREYYEELGKVLHKSILKKVKKSDPVWERVKIPGGWRAPGKYAARPLKGVWATSPYLHNNSVPTLAELLKKPQARKKTFYIGNLEYNVEEVGYVYDQKGNSTAPKFDTSLPGNSNSGHNYGTELDPEEKAALIEYLKTL